MAGVNSQSADYFFENPSRYFCLICVLNFSIFILIRNLYLNKSNIIKFTIFSMKLEEYFISIASVSSAASIVLGRRANGWLEWKNSEGKTLDEVERKHP